MKKLFNKKILSITMCILLIIVASIYTFDWAQNNKDPNYMYNDDDIVRLIITLNQETLLEYAKDDIYVEGFKRGKLTRDQLLRVDRLRKELVNNQMNVKNSIMNICEKPKFFNTYTLAFNGFSMATKYGDIEDIKKIKGVESVEISGISNKISSTNKRTNNELVDSLYYDNPLYKGDNIIVAIIDDGIDYKHKDLQMSKDVPVRLIKENIVGKGKYFSSKVPYGYNFLNQNTDITSHSDHGTAVAGVVGATGNEKDGGVKGVAPNVQLLALKVNDSDKKGINNDNVLAAMEEAIYQGADIINVSMGGYGNPANEKQFRDLSNMADDWGVIINLAAGNYAGSVPFKDFTKVRDVSTINNIYLGNHHLVIGASTDPMQKNYQLSFITKDNSQVNMSYNQLSGDPNFSGIYPITAALFKDNEFKFTERTEGKVAIISTNGIPIDNKEKVTMDALATAYIEDVKAILLVEDNPDFLNKIRTELLDEKLKSMKNLPILATSFSNIELLKSQVTNKSKIKIYDKSTRPYVNRNFTIGSFSSIGPDDDLNFKPGVMAPGVDMKTLKSGGGYKIVNGTSFSCPYVSGVGAVVLNSLRNRGIIPSWKDYKTNLIVNNIICNTSNVLAYNNNNEIKLLTNRLQGNGMANPVTAVESDIVIESISESPYIELKQIGNFKRQFMIRIKNLSKNKRVLDLASHGPVYTKDSWTNMTMSKESSLTFDKNPVTIEPEKSVNVMCTLDVYKRMPRGNFIEGLIFAQGREGLNKDIKYHIGYSGYFGDWKSINIFDELYKDPNSIFNLTNLYKYNVNEKSFTPMKISDSIEIPKGDMSNLYIYISLLRNIKSFRCDLYEENKNVLIRHLLVGGYFNKNIVSKNPIWKNDKMYLEDSRSGMGSKIVLQRADGKALQTGKYYLKVIAVPSGYTDNVNYNQEKWIPIEIK